MSYPSSHSQRAYRKTQYQQLWWLSSKKQSNCSKAYYYIGKWEWEGDCDQTMHLLRGNLIVILPVCLLSFPLLPFSVTLLQKKKKKKKKVPLTQWQRSISQSCDAEDWTEVAFPTASLTDKRGCTVCLCLETEWQRERENRKRVVSPVCFCAPGMTTHLQFV